VYPEDRKYLILPIPGFPDYFADNNGVIWSAKRGFKVRLIQQLSYKYYIVRLRANGKGHTKKVHALIALTFLGPRPEGKEACHKDDNKEDNHLENIKYDTHGNNMRDAVKNGKHFALAGVDHPGSIFSYEEVYEIKRRLSLKHKYKDIALDFQVNPKIVYSISQDLTYTSVRFP